MLQGVSTMHESIRALYREGIQSIREGGLYKDERIILTAQDTHIRVAQGEVINFCANNYLGLANHPEIIEAAIRGLRERGFGMASVRLVCGTQDIHKELEEAISAFLNTDDTILYSSCFDANGGLFEALLGPEDAVISDTLNHASIIDGIRLCRAKRYIYNHLNMGDLERVLRESRDARLRLIATDGVFSMDGDVTPLQDIVSLAERYEAVVMVDDSHATGFVGENGRGSHELCGVIGKVDVITSTLGKALGGASGGFTSGRKELVETLRQRSRPYIFSNAVAPPIISAALKALELIKEGRNLRQVLDRNTIYFRKEMAREGFHIREGDHPIVPVMLGEAGLARDMAKDLLDEGIFVIGFGYPIVPEGQARIRVQISAAHTRGQLDRAVAAFRKVGRLHGVIS
jgi:glycine C-acetyltransferase